MSIVEASRERYLHRNTLSYKLDKIISLINLDLNESDVRLLLLLSLRMLELDNR